MTLRTKAEKLRTSEISRRGYARRVGVHEKTIRDHITSGLLKPAIGKDGLINPDVADVLLARGRTRGRDVAPDLEEARRRKLAAQVRLLDDEVQELRTSRATPATLAKMFGLNYRAFAAGCAPVARVAATLAGAEPTRTFGVLTDAVYETLTDLSQRRLDSDGPDATDDAVPGGIAFDSLDAIQLAATKADLEGERLELVRATKRGDLVPIDVAMSEFGDRIAYFRGRMLGLPSRTAPLYQSAMTADEAATIAVEIIDEALFSFAGAEISHDALKQTLRDALDH